MNATSKLVRAWESKNAKNAAKFGGISLMALSLAACGGSDDTAAVVDGGTAADDATTEDTAATTTTLSTLQAQAATLLTTIAASDVAVEAATITAGSSAAVLAFNDATLAPTTAAAATTSFDALAAAVQNEIDPATSAGNGLEASNGIGLYATTTFETLATMLANDTAVTQAQITALATADASLTAAFAFEAASDSANLVTANVAANAGVALDAVSTPAASGLAAIGTALGTNVATTILVPDAVAATAAENLAGATAFAGTLQAAMLANDAAYATAFAALTAANATLVTDAILADVQTQIGNADLTQDVNTGLIIAVADAEVTLDASAGAVTVAIGALDPTAAQIINALDGAGANVLVTAVVAAANDQALDAALMAAYEGLLASIDVIAAADASSQVAAIEAANVATVSLGADNIDIDGGVATTGNDVFVFNEANGNMTVGTAATAAAPENVLFGAGDDAVIIAGEYTFVTISTAAEFAALGTTAVGDAATTELFVYQNAATGDTVLSFEDNAFDGSTTTGTAMTTLTLTDITWTGVDVNVVDGNTILSEAAVIA